MTRHGHEVVTGGNGIFRPSLDFGNIVSKRTLSSGVCDRKGETGDVHEAISMYFKREMTHSLQARTVSLTLGSIELSSFPPSLTRSAPPRMLRLPWRLKIECPPTEREEEKKKREKENAAPNRREVE